MLISLSDFFPDLKNKAAMVINLIDYFYDLIV
jgi:hypothetical protein